MLYFKLAEADVRLANETHAHQGFKFYTFSNLVLMNRRICRQGLSFESAYFILSSPGDECWFKTLSPIYVKTMRKENEVLREVDLYPTEPKFYENLHRNLIKRFSEFYGKSPVDIFDVVETANIKPKRIKIADSYRRCSLMSLKLQASPELLKFAYDAGLGEKNAMGFGCVDVLDQHMKNLTARNPN